MLGLLTGKEKRKDGLADQAICVLEKSRSVCLFPSCKMEMMLFPSPEEEIKDLAA